MGVLDDLRRKAEEQRAKQQLDSAQAIPTQDFYLKELLPRLQAALGYFKELCEHLNFVKPEIFANYPIQPEGRFMPLRQGDYKVHTDSTKEFKELLFRCSCSLEQPLAVTLLGKEKILTYSSELDRFNLKYERKDFKDANFELEKAQFNLEGPINVSVMFRADIEARTLRVLLRNVEQPGIVQHPLKLDHITKDFFDKLAAYILRQSNELLRLDITDSHREVIRQKVAAEQRLRAEELAEAERLAAEEAKRTAELEKQKKLQLKHLTDLKHLKTLADNPKLKNLTDNLKGLFTKK
ncbi:MAG: hypothetical protein HY080_10670 [Gammaproteobacteria bacterium]|nr:hypothetical protein [Gammaproteobacteria bacterium]